MTSFFSQDELNQLLDHPETIKQKERLSTSTQARFNIDIPESISLKLQQRFGTYLSNVPMRWFRGDTAEHVDNGNGTCLVYLTDSPGSLVIKDEPFPITAGAVYTFNQGVRHKTTGTSNVSRLVMGPMDRLGNSVGLPTNIFYYLTESDALAGINSIAYNGGNWVVGNIIDGSLNGITQWAVIYNGNIQPAKYTNGTDLGYAPYYGNSLSLFPANVSWSIPNVVNKNPRFRCFASDSSGTKVVTFSGINGYFGNYNPVDSDVTGIYISLDSAATWHKSYYRTDPITGIICDQNAYNIYIYTDTSSAELLFSNDGGITWNSTTPESYIRSMCCSQDGQLVYYGSNNNTDSIYRSINYGGSFINMFFLSTGLPGGARWSNVCCSSDGNIVYIASDGSGANGAIYKSIDGAATWNLVSTAPNGPTIHYNIEDLKSSGVQCTPDGSILHAVYNDEIYYYVIKSTDSGATWNPIFTTLGSAINSLSCDVSGNCLFQETLHGSPIRYNTTNVPAPVDASGYTIGCYLNTHYILLGGFNTSMNFKSINLGTSYTNLSLNINQWTDVDCDSTGNTIFAVSNAGNEFSSGLFISTNKGVTWTENTNYISGPNDLWNGCAVNSTGNVMIACGDDYGIIITSMNGGNTWVDGNISLSWTSVATNADGSKLYACTRSNYIYGCFDGVGNIWNQLDGSGSITADWSDIACDSTGNRVIACAYNGNVYYSNNAGNTWTQLNVDFTENIAWQSVASDSTGEHLVLCSTDNMSYGNVYISNNYGATWAQGGYNSALNATAVSGNGSIVYAGQNYINEGDIITTTSSNPTGWGNTMPVSPTGNWKSVSTNNDGSFVVGAMYGGPLLYINLSMVCFLGGTKILTTEGYKFIEHLKKGDLVKTLTGPVRIHKVGKRVIHNRALDTRVKDQLYLLSRDIYQELKENLVLTGCHSLLVDTLPRECLEGVKEVLGEIMLTQGKYRLPACVDPRSVVYPYPGQRTVYHVALENISDETNYGIWANGLLVESCPIKRI